MDNLWEIFPSNDQYYLDDDNNPQLLHQIPFPLQQPNGLLLLSPQEIKIRDDHPTRNLKNLNNNNNNNNNDSVGSFKKKRTRREEDYRKALHRDVEKKRRNQMADLYKSLRTLLPLQYIKGKRSASDHMQASVSYIKDLKKNIGELHNQMEIMKKTSNNIIVLQKTTDDYYDAKFNDVCVGVNKCEDDGVEILINTCGGLTYPLSKVVYTLLQQGLNVVNCCYSRQEPCSLLRIQSQANEMSDADVAALQQKLIEVVIKSH